MPEGHEAATEPARRGRARLRWWHLALGLLLVALAALPAALWWLSETDTGRAFAARQASAYTFDNGLRVEIGRIEGSLLGDARLREVTFHDLDGDFARAGELRLVWRPIALLQKRLDVALLSVPRLEVMRSWNLKRDPEAPLLPDLDIRIGRLDVGRLLLAEAVAGGLDEVTLAGAADIRAGRALVDLAADASAGDRLLFRLDAEPDGDRFDLAARLLAPSGGLVLRASGLDVPLDARLSGEGGWSDWRGRLTIAAGAEGSAAPVAELALSGRSGRFGAVGTIDPAPILADLPEALGPAIRIEATALRDGDVVEARAVASTDALALAGGGGIDLAAGRFAGVSGELRVLKPQALAPGLAAENLRAGVRLDGPVRRPEIGWDLSAARLGIAAEGGPVGVEALAARGSVQLSDGGQPLAVPFEAAAARLVGLEARLTALLAAPRAAGTVLVTNRAIRASDLRLVAAGVSARADAQANRSSGAWLADVAADAPRLALEGIGTAAVRLAARIEPGPRASGRAELRATALESTPLREALGGLPSASLTFALAADGRIRFSDGRLSSPNLRLTNGTGSLDPAQGRFAIAADGRSARFGPLAITASGTLAAPRATLRMPAPGLGVGLETLVAELQPAPGNNLLVTATGASPAGPLDARVLLRFAGGQPLAIDVERFALAGIEAKGTLVQTPAGPFAGGLAVAGQGIDGAINLAAGGPGGAAQRLSGEVSLVNARLPLDTPVEVGRGRARVTALFLPGAPQLAGDLSASAIRRESLLLTSVAARGRLVNGTLAAGVSVDGRIARRDPFTLRAQAQSIEPGLAVSLEGRLGALPLRLAQPAQIHRRPGGWELLPARLELPRGRLDLAGAVGATRFVSVVARDIDLGVVEALVPGLRLSGKVNGEARFDLPPGVEGFGSGQGSFRIEGLVRTDAAALLPVDLAIGLRSRPELFEAGVRMTNNGRELGRAVARVSSGAQGGLVERLLGGPVDGGLRFNGPVEALWALAAVEGQELRGPVALAADIGGSLMRPSLQGIARGQDLVYRNIALGTVIDGLVFEGRFRGPELLVERLSGNARGGTLTARGRIGFGAQEGETIALSGELKRARLAATDLADVTLSGPVSWRGNAGKSVLSGRLVVDEGRFVLARLEASDIPGVPVRRADELPQPPETPGFGASTLGLDVRITSGDVILIEGMGLDSRWRGDVRVTGTAANPELVGTATIVEGSYSFAGSDFDIGQGRITFNGRPLDSSLNIEASTTTSDGVTAFIAITGTASRPEIAFRSNPALPDDEILARLLFGASVADLSLPEAVQLASALATLRGGGSGGLDPVGRVRRAAGIDRLRIVGEGLTPGMGTSLVIGQRLSRNVYVEVQTDTEGNVVTIVKLALTSALDLLAQVSSISRASSINLRYQRDR
jgi:translocation and assembly module TamB